MAGEYLTRFDLPRSASGESTQPVTFDVDLARTPATVRIDLGFWVLTQMLRSGERANLVLGLPRCRAVGHPQPLP